MSCKCDIRRERKREGEGWKLEIRGEKGGGRGEFGRALLI